MESAIPVLLCLEIIHMLNTTTENKEENKIIYQAIFGTTTSLELNLPNASSIR